MARNNSRNSSRKTPATQSRQTWSSQSDGRGRGGLAKGLLTIAGGAGIGAALMYLFDPEVGPQRRRQAAECAKDALESGGAVLGSALESGGHALGSAWETVSGKAHDAASSLSESLPDVQPRKLFHRASERAHETADSWLSSARRYVPTFGPRSRGVSPAGAATASIACLAAGLGAMWLLDPARGRSRRAWLVQKGNRILNETGHFMNATGRHLRNRFKGYAHEASSLVGATGEALNDSTLAERVRSALGHLGLRGSSIGVRSNDGRIGLTGRCAADDVDRVLVIVRGIAGVRGIDNEMEVGDMYPTNPTPNTSNLSA